MLVRGFTGFGGALLTIPLLTLFLDVRLAIVSVAFIQILTGGVLTAFVRQAVDRSLLAPLLIWSLAGLAGGTILLTYLPVGWITRSLGAFAIFAGAAMVIRPNLRMNSGAGSDQRVRATVGSLSGLMQGLIGTGGPIIVPYFFQQIKTARAMRATLLAYFLVLDVLRMSGYLAFGVASQEAIAVGVLLLPAALLGSFAGSHLQVTVSERAFRLGVAFVLIGSGILLLR